MLLLFAREHGSSFPSLEVLIFFPLHGFLPQSMIQTSLSINAEQGWWLVVSRNIMELIMQKPFSLVVHLNSVRAIFSLALNHFWSLQYVSNAFLYGKLAKDILWNNPQDMKLRGSLASYVTYVGLSTG